MTNIVTRYSVCTLPLLNVIDSSEQEKTDETEPQTMIIKPVDDIEQQKLLNNSWEILKDSVVAPLKLKRYFEK